MTFRGWLQITVRFKYSLRLYTGKQRIEDQIFLVTICLATALIDYKFRMHFALLNICMCVFWQRSPRCPSDPWTLPPWRASSGRTATTQTHPCSASGSHPCRETACLAAKTRPKHPSKVNKYSTLWYQRICNLLCSYHFYHHGTCNDNKVQNCIQHCNAYLECLDLVCKLLVHIVMYVDVLV